EALEIEPVVPREVVAQVASRDADRTQLLEERCQASLRALESRGIAKDADVVPHELIEGFADGVEVARGTRKRESRTRFRLRDGLRVRLTPAAAGPRPCRHGVARDRAEDGRIRNAVASETIRAVHAARVLARGEEALEGGM